MWNFLFVQEAYLWVILPSLLFLAFRETSGDFDCPQTFVIPCYHDSKIVAYAGYHQYASNLFKVR